ncbi:MAG TPA: hypothetical protein VF755_26380 [Catenuloplanes sp.]
MSAARTSRLPGLTAMLAGTAVIAALALSGTAAAATAPAAILLSADAAGGSGDAQTRDASVTPDGRFVAFESYATDLVAGDRNGQRDVFLRDRRTGTTELISVSRVRGPANGESQVGTTAISADGRFVVFRSVATDLVAGDSGTSAENRVYVRDRLTRTTRRVSGAAPLTHAEAPSISGDGRFVAFVADDSTLVPGDTNQVSDVFVYDRGSATVRRASVGRGGVQGDNVSRAPVLSGNGRYVAFLSFAANLDPRDTSPNPDAFVRDLRTGRTEHVSRGVAGVDLADGIRQGPSISSDGRLATFASYEGQVYVRDLARQRTTLVSARPDGAPGDQFSHTASLSPDGRYVSFVSSATDLAPAHPSMIPVYRRDLRAGTTQRLRLTTADGARLDASVYLFASSNAGVVFSSTAGNLVTDGGSTPGNGSWEQLYLLNW